VTHFIRQTARPLTRHGSLNQHPVDERPVANIKQPYARPRLNRSSHETTHFHSGFHIHRKRQRRFRGTISRQAERPAVSCGRHGGDGHIGSKLIPTPNIDRLAREGLNFNDAHSPASTCTPSRFSLLTGVHAFRHKVRILPPNAPLIIPTDQTTLADVFKQAEYSTGIVGKWHGGKNTIFEGGTRVPMIIRWPRESTRTERETTTTV